MSRTRDSRRTAFRRLASRRHTDWPAYDSTPQYDRGSLDGLESDIRTVSQTWFGHDCHESVEQFVRSLLLAYFRATVQLVGNAVPLVLDVRPVRKGETRKDIVEDLLDSAEDLVHVDNVLMDREFDSQHVLEMIS